MFSKVTRFAFSLLFIFPIHALAFSSAPYKCAKSCRDAGYDEQEIAGYCSGTDDYLVGSHISSCIEQVDELTTAFGKGDFSSNSMVAVCSNASSKSYATSCVTAALAFGLNEIQTANLCKTPRSNSLIQCFREMRDLVNRSNPVIGETFTINEIARLCSGANAHVLQLPGGQANTQTASAKCAQYALDYVPDRIDEILTNGEISELCQGAKNTTEPVTCFYSSFRRTGAPSNENYKKTFINLCRGANSITHIWECADGYQKKLSKDPSSYSQIMASLCQGANSEFPLSCALEAQKLGFTLQQSSELCQGAENLRPLECAKVGLYHYKLAHSTISTLCHKTNKYIPQNEEQESLNRKFGNSNQSSSSSSSGGGKRKHPEPSSSYSTAKEDYCNFLGIPTNSTDEQINKSYKKTVFALHPDKSTPEDKQENEEKLKLLHALRDKYNSSPH
jgi:hypothetical protein